MTKKLSILILLLIVGLMLTQCSGKKENAKTENPKQETEEVLNKNSEISLKDTVEIQSDSIPQQIEVEEIQQDTLKSEKEAPKTEEKKAEEPEKKVTFIELGSVNCVPCKMMQPIMEDIEKEYGDQVDVVFYDVWTEAGKPYAAQYKIRAIPTQVFLDKEGNEYARHLGFLPKQDLLNILEKGGVKLK